ncbi:hypothetical protein R3P38DRAFT_2851399 [Favolaschia claudopus]|uniref:Uncharacterized protein n=1 Tax=Favolaschia claudopus TaxID=2862362 RepID=A0AAW0DPI4_9AGAR
MVRKVYPSLRLISTAAAFLVSLEWKGRRPVHLPSPHSDTLKADMRRPYRRSRCRQHGTNRHIYHPPPSEYQHSPPLTVPSTTTLVAPSRLTLALLPAPPFLPSSHSPHHARHRFTAPSRRSSAHRLFASPAQPNLHVPLRPWLRLGSPQPHIFPS